jgi:hypothetical protein
MKGESVLVDNVMLYYKCVDLIYVCTNHVYVFVIQRTHTVSLLCNESVLYKYVMRQFCMVMPVLKPVNYGYMLLQSMYSVSYDIVGLWLCLSYVGIVVLQPGL